MAPTKTTQVSSTTSHKGKKAQSSVGAPAQLNQSSRKGKKAWRKNIDIEDVEEVLEGLRAEERITGSTVQKKTDEELFQIDVKGDENVRRSLPKFSPSQLTSAKILAQRSAVPAIVSRLTCSNHGKRKLTHEEKERLLRIGKRPRKGPFNAVMDPTEFGAGSAMLDVTEAVKQSGTYDVWGTEVPDAGKVKPKTASLRKKIAVPAVPSPHEGTSYNPPVISHQELLRTAVEIEERRQKDAEELEQLHAKHEQVRNLQYEPSGGAAGMAVDEVREDEKGEENTEEVRLPKKMPERKTKQERKKAEKLRAEKRALAERIARKRMLASVDSAKSLRKAIAKKHAVSEALRQQREAEEQERLKKEGLAGQRLGKHKVPEGEIDVQLGEELTESLRQLKPEGNLFRDRFLSMQHRALVEPRVPVLPKKRRTKFKEYEKHAWKRFDMEY
ncbi:tumor suppressor protein Gltscr2 [Obba rivulosa]|uniref:Ribosome biogenesis protein NOP53 n=1 Tax=Obba rivulosa TaxID=1052685 RepID=A0A8E2AYA3_9APHY|nr:tumor suppressor protein Gltscr2 [Obba rivulosa]